jgi:uncharacterized protein HemY
MPAASGAETDRLLALAISQHRPGQLSEAERTYRQILQHEPRNADSLHLLGIIAHQRGEHDKAVDLIRRAIAARASGETGRLRGLILRGLTEPWGRPDELVPVAMSILMRDDALRAVVARAAATWPQRRDRTP